MPGCGGWGVVVVDWVARNGLTEKLTKWLKIWKWWGSNYLHTGGKVLQSEQPVQRPRGRSVPSKGMIWERRGHGGKPHRPCWLLEGLWFVLWTRWQEKALRCSRARCFWKLICPHIAWGWRENADSDSVDLRWVLRSSSFYKLPGDIILPVWGPHCEQAELHPQAEISPTDSFWQRGTRFQNLWALET